LKTQLILFPYTMWVKNLIVQ